MAKIKLGIRVWICIICLVLAVLAINPSGYFKKGVLIKNVRENSIASLEGFSAGEIIKKINMQQIKNMEDYTKIITSFEIKPTQFAVETNKGIFSYKSASIGFEIDGNSSITKVSGNASIAGIKENMTVLKVNDYNVSKENFKEIKDKTESRINLNIKTNKQNYFLSISEPLDFVVSDVPATNLKAGLDIQGGARGLVKPERKLTSAELENLLLVSRERFNVYGISDINVRSATDLSGNTYMLIEVAGATPQELENLIGKQGKFEAKVGNDTVFIGGKNDITSVCRNDATCARIETCLPSEFGGYFCEFSFAIYLSEAAAKKQAEATANLSENISSGGKSYLSSTLDLYLDDKLVDKLQISSDLKGKDVTQISISGPGYGTTESEAYENAQKSMLKLQTILITGSLPFKLEIVKLDSISPLLGNEFIKSIAIAIAVAIVAVSSIIILRYKRTILFIPIIFTIISETILVLGIAALISWNIDLASIAGIIAAIGTGVDDQIVIVDESKTGKEYSLKERVKRAFAIVLGAFTTNFVAMIPLFWAGAGLMRGFALTTILGITVGVLITRPAFAEILGQITKE